MNDLNGWGLDQATEKQCRQEAERLVDDAVNRMRQPLVDAVTHFFLQPLSPMVLMLFEVALLGLVREMGRLLLEAVLNACEPELPDLLPKDVWFECGGYRRRKQKTANRNVASRFGDIVPHRRGYRSWQAGDGSVFPLEMLLGLNHSATPALVDWMGRQIADAGANQAVVIQRLRTECGVTMGVKRLRQCIEQLSGSMDEFRQQHQVDALLESLRQAADSSGSRKPVIAARRDGMLVAMASHFASTRTTLFRLPRPPPSASTIVAASD